MNEGSSRNSQEDLPNNKLANKNSTNQSTDPILPSIDDPNSDKAHGHRESIEITSGPEDAINEQHERRFALAEVPAVTEPMPLDSAEGPKQDAQPVQLYENKLIIFAALIPVSILGMLIRVGLTLLETYDGEPVFALAYAQFIGCTIMGFVVKKKDFLLKKYLPLQIALSTGLCGSITTFSSWQLAIYQAFANTSGDSHATGYNVRVSLEISVRDVFNRFLSLCLCSCSRY
jgi:fluoride ion exporter CrcB/FEX